MSEPKYLVSEKSGRIFPFTKALLRRSDMVPAADAKEAQAKAEKHGAKPVEIKSHSLPNKPQNPGGNDAESDDDTAEEGQGDDFVISKATKDELEVFAKDNYGVDLDKRKSVATLREEVLALAE